MPSTDVLIIGTSTDPHIDAVVNSLSRNINTVRFDVDQFPRKHQLTLVQSRLEDRIFFEDGQKSNDITNPGVVWFRRLGSVGISELVPDKYRQFCIGEADMALEGMLSLLNPSHWVNEYWSARRGANKPYQYNIARRSNLIVPDTLTTNSPERAIDWAKSQPTLIVKSLHSPLVTRDEVDTRRTIAHTKNLDDAAIVHIGNVITAPCQFQPGIEKSHELRVTSYGDQHVAVRIDADQGGGQDWRATIDSNSYSPASLSDETVKNLEIMMGGLNLQYAASDFIVTPQGEEVFLEANPHGAWLWLENRVSGLDIAQGFAQYLGNVALEARG